MKCEHCGRPAMRGFIVCKRCWQIFGSDEMGEVIQLPKRNVQHAKTDELKKLWDGWSGEPNEPLGEFDFETVYLELNRRGEGQHCAV